MRTGEKGDYVRQRQIPRSEASFRRYGNSKAETESIDSDIDQMYKDAASGPGSEKPVTMKEVRVSEVFGREKRDPISYRPGEELDEDEDKEKTASGRRIYLGGIHRKSRNRETRGDLYSLFEPRSPL